VGDSEKRALYSGLIKLEKAMAECVTFNWDFTVTQEMNGAPGEIRTPDHCVRSAVLYPTELRARAHIVAGLVGLRIDPRDLSGSVSA
jgi:hypothetical protein